MAAKQILKAILRRVPPLKQLLARMHNLESSLRADLYARDLTVIEHQRLLEDLQARIADSQQRFDQQQEQYRHQCSALATLKDSVQVLQNEGCKVTDARVATVDGQISDIYCRLSAMDQDISYRFEMGLHRDDYRRALEDWYYSRTHLRLDLDNPQTFNEKIQWLKLYDSTPIKTRLSDKFLVRDWVCKTVGRKYVTPLLGVWDDFDAIDFDTLPKRFVLKATHGSGWNMIVKDKSSFQPSVAKFKFDAWMRTNFAFWAGLELHYVNIQPRIIAETYLENDGGDLPDYKVWCFDGEPHYVMLVVGRATGARKAFYDLDWALQSFVYDHPRLEETVPRPDNLQEIIELARELSRGFCHSRVDIYRLDDGSLRFGEITFTSSSGIAKWNPRSADLAMGRLLTLPDRGSER